MVLKIFDYIEIWKKTRWFSRL